MRATTWRRGWDSNPRTPVKMLLEFQSSAFDRSATSPINGLQQTPRNNSEAEQGEDGRRIIKHAAGLVHPTRARARLEPRSGLRGLRHLERRRLVETGLPALARRRRRLVERRQMQCVGGIGRI